ncbi:hypothetical protein J3D45_000003 [Microbacterium foliorum]|uniref:hypothetical protein n=1 Tax=Microbacterium foliorum TaxID=104336 RepID=UPI0020A0E48E|nr:hypothetical protein [Microbacterium foliorum]MCP1427505.1 hypothetical protein [Microbacterium foliorum]
MTTNATAGRSVRAVLGAAYVGIPVIISLALITPVLAWTTSPVGVHPDAPLPLAAVFALSLLLPVVGAVPVFSRLVPRGAVFALAVSMSVLSISWIAFVGWSFTLGTSGGRIELLTSVGGFAAALICATVSVWPATLSALAMTIPNRSTRTIVLCANALLGVTALLLSTARATV